MWLCLIICNRMWFSETKEKIKDLVFFQYRNHLKSWTEGELCFKSAGTNFCYPKDWLFLIKGNRVTCRILHCADCRLLITNKWRMVRKEGKKVLSDSGCSWDCRLLIKNKSWMQFFCFCQFECYYYLPIQSLSFFLLKAHILRCNGNIFIVYYFFCIILKIDLSCLLSFTICCMIFLYLQLTRNFLQLYSHHIGKLNICDIYFHLNNMPF